MTAPGGPCGSGAECTVIDQIRPELACFDAGHLELASDLARAGLPPFTREDRLRCAAGDGDALSVRAELEGLAAVAECVSHGCQWVVTDVIVAPVLPCCDLPRAGLTGGTLQPLDAVDHHQLLHPLGIQAGKQTIGAA